mgnify:CR=1 FL=1
MKKFDLNFYSGKRVLVTGHTGFKGTWLCRLLLNMGAQVTGYSLQPPTEPSIFGLAGMDRQGAVIMNGIEGETRPYNGTDYTYYSPSNIVMTENEDGTVYYDVTIRDDLKFSDGTPVDIDDAIFTLYVYADPTYDGSTPIYSQPIVGMEEYRSGMATLSSLIAAAGEDNTDFSLWTEEQQTAFWAAVNDGGVKFAQEIVDYMTQNNGATDVVSAAAGASSFRKARMRRHFSWQSATSTAGAFLQWKLRQQAPRWQT